MLDYIRLMFSMYECHWMPSTPVLQESGCSAVREQISGSRPFQRASSDCGLTLSMRVLAFLLLPRFVLRGCYLAGSATFRLFAGTSNYNYNPKSYSQKQLSWPSWYADSLGAPKFESTPTLLPAHPPCSLTWLGLVIGFMS